MPAVCAAPDNIPANVFKANSPRGLVLATPGSGVQVSSAAGDPVYAAFSVTFTFSEDVTGFIIGDITVGNGAASNFVAVSGSIYTADITPTTAGAVTVSVGAGVCQDAVGNPNEASNTLSRTCGWFVMTVTTTGAQQLKLDGLTVSASTTACTSLT